MYALVFDCDKIWRGSLRLSTLALLVQLQGGNSGFTFSTVPYKARAPINICVWKPPSGHMTFIQRRLNVDATS